MELYVLRDQFENMWSELEEDKPEGYEDIQKGIEMCIEALDTIMNQ